MRMIASALTVWLLLTWTPPMLAQPSVPEGVTVREGFELSVAVDDVERARFLAVGDEGELYISLPHAGEILSCRDADGDGLYETRATFVEGHPTVHGLQFYEGWLWYTETGAIFRARDVDSDGRADETETIIARGNLPRGGGHWWRPILIHNDRLYTAIGDSGNITDQRDTPRQKIWSYGLDGARVTDERLFCSGIRNTEKLVVRPGTDEIWGMDHGSDWFGRVIEQDADVGQPITDLNPPDEMNHYIQNGFYGHPFVVGPRVVRYEFLDLPDIAELAAATIPPEWPTGAHWAPNAMCFYTGQSLGPDIAGDAFVTYHGSWNRSRRSGYCVTRVRFEDGHPWGEQVMVSFLDDQRVLGRPVDVIEDRDGSLLISDDHGHRVYRLSRADDPAEEEQQ